VENATVAIAVARSLDISEENIRQALSSFKGVKRRFEYVLKTPKVTYIDDYAHHPKEVEAFLHSIKAMYPHQKVTAIFQPHLYSRTQDFATEFAKSLDLADDVILLEIYPARELPIKGVSSALISDKMEIKHKIICQKSHLLDELESRKESLEVLVTIGAGDIGQMTHSIAELIKK
jgi:UDP-N-acetylmuramate--alanine ligase